MRDCMVLAERRVDDMCSSADSVIRVQRVRGEKKNVQRGEQGGITKITDGRQSVKAQGVCNDHVAKDTLCCLRGCGAAFAISFRLIRNALACALIGDGTAR